MGARTPHPLDRYLSFRDEVSERASRLNGSSSSSDSIRYWRISGRIPSNSQRMWPITG